MASSGWLLFSKWKEYHDVSYGSLSMEIKREVNEICKESRDRVSKAPSQMFKCWLVCCQVYYTILITLPDNQKPKSDAEKLASTIGVELGRNLRIQNQIWPSSNESIEYRSKIDEMLRNQIKQRTFLV